MEAWMWPVKIVSKQKKRKHTGACDRTVVLCLMLLLVDTGQGDAGVGVAALCVNI